MAEEVRARHGMRVLVAVRVTGRLVTCVSDRTLWEVGSTAWVGDTGGTGIWEIDNMVILQTGLAGVA